MSNQSSPTVILTGCSRGYGAIIAGSYLKTGPQAGTPLLLQAVAKRIGSSAFVADGVTRDRLIDGKGARLRPRLQTHK